MTSNIKKALLNATSAKKGPSLDSGVFPPRYQPPPQPKTAFPPASHQDVDSAVAIGDSGKQFQTVAEIDR